MLGAFMGCLFPLSPKDRRYGSLVGVTSAAPGEGVSTMAQCLTQAALMTGKNAMFVPRIFNEQQQWKCVSHGASRSASSSGGTFDTSPELDSPRELPDDFPMDTSDPQPIADARTSIWLRELRNAYEFVFFDIRPVNTGLAPILGQLDGVVVVVSEQTVDREALRQTVEQFGVGGIPVLGMILNKRRRYIPRWMYKLI
jgi:Mrp family chromosome partitioning ATPase